MNHNCLNCNSSLASNYCQDCGQKATTHRYSVKHFIEHDLIHGIWHFDKGIFFTLKQLFNKPGHNVREFINGKRANFFNFFTLLLLIIATGHFIDSYSTIKMADIIASKDSAVVNKFEDLFKKYPKLQLIIIIPISSLLSFLWFRKAKLNITEHLVLNSYKTAAETCFGVVFSIIAVFYTNKEVLSKLYLLVSISVMVYSVLFYCQFFSVYGMSKKSVFFRSIGITICYLLSFVFLGYFLKSLGKI